MKQEKQNGGLVDLLSFVTEQTMQMAKQNAVIGEPIEKNGLTILPVSRFSASFAGGGSDSVGSRGSKQLPAGGGAKVSLVPMSFLVIDGSDVRVVNLQAEAQSPVSEIVDSVLENFANKKTEESS